MNFIDFLFPPLCLCCRSRSPLPFFCSTCWELCSPIDPASRCKFCFAEMETEDCFSCRKTPLFFSRGVVFESTFPARFLCKEEGEALAAFAFYQWIQLEWEMPDIVIAMPGVESIAKDFTSLFNVANASPEPSYAKWDLSLFEEGQTFLLLDRQSSLKTLCKAAHPLLEASPKKIFQLSLMDHDDTSHF